jgi:hypothetical protein
MPVRLLRRALAAGAAALWATAAPAAALRYCDRPAEASPAEQDRLLRVGALIKAELEASGQRVALIARSGLDLRRFGVRYSHAGVSLQASPNTPWSVRQLYYACDERRPRLFDQGLAGFLLGVDDPALGYISIVLLPAADSAALERAALDNARALSLLGGTYSANAHPWSLRYQNCNQWLAELLALAQGAFPADTRGAVPAQTPGASPSATTEGVAAEARGARSSQTSQTQGETPDGISAKAEDGTAVQRPSAATAATPGAAPEAPGPARPQAQQWLQQHGYAGSAIALRNPLLWLAPALVPWLHLDDHPAEDLQRGVVSVSLPESIEAWLHGAVPGARRIELCHTERAVVIRRGWKPLPEGCRAEDGDTVVPLDA